MAADHWIEISDDYVFLGASNARRVTAE